MKKQKQPKIYYDFIHRHHKGGFAGSHYGETIEAYSKANGKAALKKVEESLFTI